MSEAERYPSGVLWVAMFALPVAKMAILAAFVIYVWRSEGDRGEEVEVDVGIGPDRPRGPRTPRRPDRGGPARRLFRRRSALTRRARLGSGSGW